MCLKKRVYWTVSFVVATATAVQEVLGTIHRSGKMLLIFSIRNISVAEAEYACVPG